MHQISPADCAAMMSAEVGREERKEWLTDMDASVLATTLYVLDDAQRAEAIAEILTSELHEAATLRAEEAILELPEGERSAALAALPPAERVEVMVDLALKEFTASMVALPADERAAALEALPLEQEVITLLAMDPEHRAEALSGLPREEEVRILHEFPAKAMVETLGAMPAEAEAAVLGALAEADRVREEVEVQEEALAAELTELDPTDRLELLEGLDPEVRLHVLGDLPREALVETLGALPTEEAVAVMQDLASDYEKRARHSNDLAARKKGLAELPAAELADALAAMGMEGSPAAVLLFAVEAAQEQEHNRHLKELQGELLGMDPEDRVGALRELPLHDRNQMVHNMVVIELAEAIEDETMSVGEEVAVLHGMRAQEVVQVLNHVSATEKRNILDHMSDADRLAEQIEEKVIILEELPPIQRAAVLREMPKDLLPFVFDQMPKAMLLSTWQAMPPDDVAEALSGTYPGRPVLEDLSAEAQSELLLAVKAAEVVLMNALPEVKAGWALEHMSIQDKVAALEALEDPAERVRLLESMSEADRAAVLSMAEAGREVDAFPGDRIDSLEKADAIQNMNAADRVAALESMTAEERSELFHDLPEETITATLELMSAEQRTEALSELPSGALEGAHILAALSAGQRAEALRGMSPADEARVLSSMSEADRTESLCEMGVDEAASVLMEMDPAMMATALAALPEVQMATVVMGPLGHELEKKAPGELEMRMSQVPWRLKAAVTKSIDHIKTEHRAEALVHLQQDECDATLASMSAADCAATLEVMTLEGMTESVMDMDGGQRNATLACMHPEARASSLLGMFSDDRNAILASMPVELREETTAMMHEQEAYHSLNPEGKAAMLAGLAVEKRIVTFKNMPPEDRAATVVLLDVAQRNLLLTGMSGEKRATTLEALPADQQFALLAAMPASLRNEIEASMKLRLQWKPSITARRAARRFKHLQRQRLGIEKVPSPDYVVTWGVDEPSLGIRFHASERSEEYHAHYYVSLCRPATLAKGVEPGMTLSQVDGVSLRRIPDIEALLVQRPVTLTFKQSTGKLSHRSKIDDEAELPEVEPKTEPDLVSPAKLRGSRWSKKRGSLAEVTGMDSWLAEREKLLGEVSQPNTPGRRLTARSSAKASEGSLTQRSKGSDTLSAIKPQTRVLSASVAGRAAEIARALLEPAADDDAVLETAPTTAPTMEEPSAADLYKQYAQDATAHGRSPGVDRPAEPDEAVPSVSPEREINDTWFKRKKNKRRDSVDETGLSRGDRERITKHSERAKTKFRQLDKDGSDFIEGQEVLLLSEWVWMSFRPGQVITSDQKLEQAEKILKQCDTDNNGKISRAEFEVYYVRVAEDMFRFHKARAEAARAEAGATGFPEEK